MRPSHNGGDWCREAWTRAGVSVSCGSWRSRGGGAGEGSKSTARLCSTDSRPGHCAHCHCHPMISGWKPDPWDKRPSPRDTPGLSQQCGRIGSDPCIGFCTFGSVWMSLGYLVISLPDIFSYVGISFQSRTSLYVQGYLDLGCRGLGCRGPWITLVYPMSVFKHLWSNQMQPAVQNSLSLKDEHH